MAEMEMVERVARAISIDLGEDPDALDVLIRGRDGKRPHWEGFESTARAAIEAMREVASYGFAIGGETPIWQAMIDTALNGPAVTVDMTGADKTAEGIDAGGEQGIGEAVTHP